MQACYLCSNPLPQGQSFYQDHSKFVCLQCFKDSPRCKKCKFPSKQLAIAHYWGMVCEFCQEELNKSIGSCQLCQAEITISASHYADAGRLVCQKCFIVAKRCFICAFPQSAQTIAGFGDVCPDCLDPLFSPQSDLSAVTQPILKFLASLKVSVDTVPQIKWVDWNLLLGMQHKERPPCPIKRLDDFLRYAYPVFYLKGTLYTLKRMTPSLLLTHISGQLAAAQLCSQYQLPHLLDDSPFFELARSWVHWVSYTTAQILKYEKEQKLLTSRPEWVLKDFKKLQAMSQFNPPTKIVLYAHSTLANYAKKYLFPPLS